MNIEARSSRLSNAKMKSHPAGVEYTVFAIPLIFPNALARFAVEAPTNIRKIMLSMFVAELIIIPSRKICKCPTRN